MILAFKRCRVFLCSNIFVLKQINKRTYHVQWDSELEISALRILLLGRETFPKRYGFYRVPVSTHLRRESLNCDS